jgi:hypothetical protein
MSLVFHVVVGVVLRLRHLLYCCHSFLTLMKALTSFWIAADKSSKDFCTGLLEAVVPIDVYQRL